MLGHEGADVVERIGKAVMVIKPGDHVVLSYNPAGAAGLASVVTRRAARSFGRRTFALPVWTGPTHCAVAGVVTSLANPRFATHSLATERKLVKCSGTGLKQTSK